MTSTQPDAAATSTLLLQAAEFGDLAALQRALADGASAPAYSAAALQCKPALPFRATGSLGMLHSAANADDASSEFFILSQEGKVTS